VSLRPAEPMVTTVIVIERVERVERRKEIEYRVPKKI
jgi:hypothetical protein